MVRIYYQITIFWTALLLGLPSTKANFNPHTPPILSNPSGCNLALPINDFSCDASHEFKINVVTAPGTSMGQDVFLREVRLIVKHEWDADLDMYLISPGGVEVELSTDNGSGNDNYGDPDNGLCDQFTSFVSHSLPEACGLASIVNGNAPFIGEYLPEESLGKFNDYSSPLGLWTLKICDDGKEHYGTLEFAELVFQASTCLPPTQVHIVSVDSTSVVLDWVHGSNCDSTIIEFGPVGFSPGTVGAPGGGFVTPGSCPPFTLTGLQPSTDYTFFIRENCGTGNFSINSCAVTATTQCSPPPATLIENFDDQALCEPFCGVVCPLTGHWRNVGNDHFDWLVNKGPTSTSLTGPEDDVPGGGNYLYVETSGSLCQNGKTAYLFSDCIEVQAGDTGCDMTFNYSLYGANINELALEVTTNGGLTWQSLWQAGGNQGSEWKKAFIDLSALDSLTAQFRFVGRGGNGVRGDIAIDNIIFYGSEIFTGEVYTYYRDADGDGFGDANSYIVTCEQLDPAPAGYVTNGDDCNDSDAQSYPGAMETPCDGIDNNCNGDDDEYFLLPVLVQSDTVCNGETATLFAQGFFGGDIHWYDAGSGGNLVFIGNAFQPVNQPVNSTPNPLELTFFVEEITADSCVSYERQAASLVILPSPQLATADVPSGCLGEPFDLTTVDVVDEHGVNGLLSYLDESGAEIPSVVYPDTTSDYLITSTAEGGCRDTLVLNYVVKPTPQAVIAGDTTLCRNQETTLSASDTGSGTLPLNFEWNYNSQTNPTIQITNNLPLGQSATYSVRITGSNGCSSTASVTVESVTSINAIQVLTEPESSCNEGDGEISLTPMGGVAPFNYQWQGGIISELPAGLNLTGLSQGAYAFTVTDSGPEGCNFVIPVVVVDGPSMVTTIEEITPVSCYGEADGCIEISVVGANPSILWSTGSTSEIVCGLAAGTYEVTITDGDCENVLTIPLPQPAEPLFAKQDVRNISCFGRNDGAIELTVFGGTPPYQYQWNNGQNMKNINNLVVGDYSVTVTDARGCSVVLSDLAVAQPLPVSLDTVSLKPPSCFGGTDGELSILPWGGSLPYSLAWSNGGAGSALTNLAKGTYSITITDVKGCSFSQAIQLGEPPALSISIDQAVEPACNGLNNGSLSIIVSGGSGSYSYQWNNGAITPDLQHIGSGKYQVTVTDQKNCTAVSPLVDLPGPEFMQVAFNIVHPPCVGRDEGVASVQVLSGGIPPYQYFWSTDDSEPILTGLSGGEYEVTIVDGNGCQYDTTLVLAAIQTISIDMDTFHLSCFENNSGRLKISALTGVAPFNITWSTGEQGNEISGLQSGNYQATITDNLGCKLFTDPIFLEQPPALQPVLDYAEGNACFGDIEGNIQIDVTGGTLPYSYFWSNNEHAKNISGLEEGDYSLTVTDANGCTAYLGPIHISTPDLLQISFSAPTPEDCLPFQLDSLCLNTWGGTAPYRFKWSTGDTTTCLHDVMSGDYHITVTDMMGCTAELMSVKVLEEYYPVQATRVPTNKEKICPDVNDGVVAVAVRNGYRPYQFIWSNGQTGVSDQDTIYLENLPPAAYNVTITDNIGCTAVSPWTEITTDGFLLLSAPGSQVQHVKCKNETSGAIEVNVSGGNAPYSLVWTDEENTVLGDSTFISNLGAGVYYVLAMDQNGCTGSMSIQISEPASVLGISAPVVGHISCFGAHDGTISLLPVGGIPPYTFEWSNGAVTRDLSNLGPGIYTITVTDSNLCTFVSPGIEVLSPEAPLSLQEVLITPASCFDAHDGAIDITVWGGTPPYSYTWGLLSNAEDLNGIPAGTYHLTVADSNLFCLIDTAFVVPQPDSLHLSLQITPAGLGLPNGAIVAFVSGGVPPYLYNWGNGPVLGEDSLLDIFAGDYVLSVLDSNQCSKTVYITVPLVNETLERWNITDIRVHPNPSSGLFWLDIAAISTIQPEVEVFNAIGQSVFSKKEEKMKGGALMIDLSEQPPGLYLTVLWIDDQPAFSSKVLVVK